MNIEIRHLHQAKSGYQEHMTPRNPSDIFIGDLYLDGVQVGRVNSLNDYNNDFASTAHFDLYSIPYCTPSGHACDGVRCVPNREELRKQISAITDWDDRLDNCDCEWSDDFLSVEMPDQR